MADTTDFKAAFTEHLQNERARLAKEASETRQAGYDALQAGCSWDHYCSYDAEADACDREARQVMDHGVAAGYRADVFTKQEADQLLGRDVNTVQMNIEQMKAADRFRNDFAKAFEEQQKEAPQAAAESQQEAKAAADAKAQEAINKALGASGQVRMSEDQQDLQMD